MGTIHWDIMGIGTALGAEVTQSKPEVYCLRLTHPRVGTRLKLEMAPALEAIRLWCGHPVNGTPGVLARTDVFRVTEVLVDQGQGEVRFRTAEPHPTELLVTEDATFSISVGVLLNGRLNGSDTSSGDASPAPARIEPGNGDDGLIQLVGKLARPHFSDRTGKPFFTAGLAEHPDGAMAPVWHNLKAFGSVALNAQHLERGSWVRLSGKEQEDRYQKAGQDTTKTVILLVHIEAAD